MAARIMILAGGTGGHVFPALAVADYLREQGYSVCWMGTRKGLEARLVPAAHIDIDWLSVAGLRGKGGKSWITAPFMLLQACCQAAAILRRRKPNAVLGMGGFVAGPGGLMAWLLGIPLLIHEQNRVPGTTNRLLSRLARGVMEAFPGSFKGAVEAMWTGNPIRKDIAALAEPRRYEQGRPLRVLILGGSQGAQVLNSVVPKAIARMDGAVEVLHQSGQSMLCETRSSYEKSALKARVEAFIEHMAEAYRWADIAVCRAGAMTISELTATGLGAILVPFPHAIDDHQTQNARYMADAGAALMLPQAEFDENRLAELLMSLAREPERLHRMAQAARSLARLDATQTVADICLQEAR